MSKKPEEYVPHREASVNELPACPVTKAYRNSTFLNSSHARHIRILCEYEETMQRLRAASVRATVMFFGSARSKDHEAHQKAVAKAQAQLAAAEAGSEPAAAAAASLSRLEAIKWMCDYMEKIRELSRKITQWSVDSATRHLEVVSGVARVARLKRAREEGTSSDNLAKRAAVEVEPVVEPAAAPAPAGRTSSLGSIVYKPHSSDDVNVTPGGTASPFRRDKSTSDADAGSLPVYVCTGGGPGFMEAANHGASDVKGGKSIGMGITLPFEAGLNPFVTPELAFEYHYFFTRKFWMAFHMQALIVAPGGFGTMDELFELLTLKQTNKIQKSLPVVLFGKQYWKSVINWQTLGVYGVINPLEVDELLFTDDVQEAFEYIVRSLEAGPTLWKEPEMDEGAPLSTMTS